MTDSTDDQAAQEAGLADAPEVPQASRTGRYALYDRTLAQYVPESIQDAKHTKSEADALTPEGSTVVSVGI